MAEQAAATDSLLYTKVFLWLGPAPVCHYAYALIMLWRMCTVHYNVQAYTCYTTSLKLLALKYVHYMALVEAMA